MQGPSSPVRSKLLSSPLLASLLARSDAQYKSSQRKRHFQGLFVLLIGLAYLVWQARHSSVSTEWISSFVSSDDTIQPSRGDFNVQTEILKLLQPTTEYYDSTPPRDMIEEDGAKRYRMLGINYNPSSLSSRLQRLPLLSHRLDEIYRFPSNPAIVRHPALKPENGQEPYLLSIQLGSGWFERQTDRNAKVVYHDGGFGWSVKHISMTMRLSRTSSSEFELAFEDEKPFGAFHKIDMRMISVNQTDLIVYGKPNEGSTFLDWQRLADGEFQWKPRARSHFTFTDNVNAEARDETKWIEQKNWVAAISNEKLFFIPHISPFTVVDCGLPVDEEWHNCSLHAYAKLDGTLAPSDSSSWRGSVPLMPLPSSNSLALGMIHQRAKPGKQPAGETFKDRYTHRFICINTQHWQLVAFSDPFAFFSHHQDVDWFEFPMGMVTFGQQELVITLGFNDQEPWLAILPIQLAIRSLKPVHSGQQKLLNALARDWNGL